MKIIKVENCETCPYRAVYPIKDGVARVPFCNNTGIDLPYKLATKSVEPTAAPLNEIPEWCHLEDVSLPAQVLM